MTVTSAFAPFDISYTQRTPYITSQEYNSAPTAMDTSNLVTGSAQANVVALTETIARASSWIDEHCMGSWGTLAATSQVENARIWGSYRSSLLVKTRFWPVLEVSSFSYSALAVGIASGNATSITPSGNITIYPQSFEVQPAGVVGLGLNAPGGIVRGYEYTCQWIYIAGWPVSTLAASVAAGGTQFTPNSALGIYPGTMLTVYDEPYNETIQVSSLDTSDIAPVLLTSGFQYPHASGVMVTNLPPAVKQAAILLTTALIKQRGSGALIVNDMNEVTHAQSGFPQGEDPDVALAAELLAPLRQVYLGY